MSTTEQTTTYARTHRTNAGSIRKGDVLAEGHNGYRVLHTTADGTRRAVAAQSLYYAEHIAAFLYTISESVGIVHPDDIGQPLAGRTR